MFLNKKNLLYLTFIFSLFFGFYFEENSSGGAKLDSEYLLPYIESFSLNFSSGLEKYLNNVPTSIHSPVFYILIGYLKSIFGDLFYFKLFYLLISSFLPLIFFKILKEKFNIHFDYLFYISLILFVSPYFRSSAIWFLADNLSLIFLGLSILYMLKANNSKNFNLIILSLIFLVICSYIRYYFAIYFLYISFIVYKNFSLKYLYYFFLISFFLSIPALVYLYYILNSYQFIDTLSAFGGVNYLSSGLIIFSIFLFYIFPIIINDLKEILEYYKKNFLTLLFFLIIILLIFFLDLMFENNLIVFATQGGGIFVKIIRLFDLNLTIVLLILTLISLLLLDYLFKENRINNYLIILLTIFSLSLRIVFQKYLDPLFFIFLFSIINSNLLNNKIIKKNINIKFVYSYYISFYFLSLIYYK